MQISNTVKAIDSWPLFVIIGIGTACHQIPSLTKKLYTKRFYIKIVFFVFPITVVCYIENLI